MRSVVDRNVVMRRMTVQNTVGILYTRCGTNHQSDSALITRNSTLRIQVVIFISVTSIMAIKRLMSINLKLNSVALVRERTIPTERPPPVGEVSANFCG